MKKQKKRKASAGKQKVNEDNAIAHVTLGLNLSCCACVHEEHDRETKRNGNWIKSPRDNNLIDGVGLIWKTVRTSEKFLTSPQFAAREQQLRKRNERETLECFVVEGNRKLEEILWSSCEIALVLTGFGNVWCKLTWDKNYVCTDIQSTTMNSLA